MKLSRLIAADDRVGRKCIVMSLTPDEFALIGEALRTAFLATRNPAFLALLGNGDKE